MSNQIVFARMREEDVKLLRKVCKYRGENISSFVRRAVLKELAELSYLPNSQKKALGIMAEEPHRESEKVNY